MKHGSDMASYLIKITKHARYHLAKEMAWSRREYGRDSQIQFLSEILQALTLISNRTEIHQVRTSLGKDVRQFTKRGLKIAYQIDDAQRRVVVLAVAGRRQEMEATVSRALAAWEAERSADNDNKET